MYETGDTDLYGLQLMVKMQNTEKNALKNLSRCF